MWPLASKRARDKHPEASLKGRRAGGATTVTAGQRTPSGALMAKALTDGADEAKSGGMGTGRASRTPRGSPGAIWTELWAPQGGYAAAAAKPVWIPLQCSRVYYTALYPWGREAGILTCGRIFTRGFHSAMRHEQGQIA